MDIIAAVVISALGLGHMPNWAFGQFFGYAAVTELFQGLLFYIILLWYACFGGYIATMRHRLHRQNQ